MHEYSEHGVKYFGFKSVRTGNYISVNGFTEFKNFEALALELGEGRQIEIAYFRKLAPDWAFKNE